MTILATLRVGFSTWSGGLQRFYGAPSVAVVCVVRARERERERERESERDRERERERDEPP